MQRKPAYRLIQSAALVLVALLISAPAVLGSTWYSTSSGGSYYRSGWYNSNYYSTRTGGYVRNPVPSYRPTTPSIPSYPAPAPAPAPVPQPTPSPAPVPTPVPQPIPQPQPAPTPSAGLTAQEAAMLNLLNQERMRNGLAALQVDNRLVNVARQKSQDMLANNYFGHTSPTYGSPFQMMRAAGISYRTAGENLAGASSAETAHSALMNSSGHRANILNPAYTHVGIGAVSGSRFGMLFTQMFLGN